MKNIGESMDDDRASLTLAVAPELLPLNGPYEVVREAGDTDEDLACRQRLLDVAIVFARRSG